MTSTIIASVPIHGHVTPLLAVARHLVGRGDRVRFITGARFADAVTATGATHVPLPAAADFDDREDLHERFPERAAVKWAKALAFDIEHLFIRPARPQHDAVKAAHAAEPADAVLADPAFAGGALVLATGVPSVRPWWWVACCRCRSPAAIPPLWARTPAHEVVQPNPQQGADDADPSDLQWREPHCRRHAPRPAPRPAALPDPRLGRARRCHRPVHRACIRIPGAPATLHFVGPTLEALADDDVLVVVSTGGRPLDTLPPLPDNARAAEYLSYDELLPRTDVFVTNGGYGGVQYALRHGVPVVATGGKEDKPEVGARVVWSGVGRRIRAESPKPRALRRAIRRVLHDPRDRDASRRIAADMAAAPGLDGPIATIDAVTRPATASDDPQPAHTS